MDPAKHGGIRKEIRQSAIAGDEGNVRLLCRRDVLAIVSGMAGGVNEPEDVGRGDVIRVIGHVGLGRAVR